ncbi:MAG: hypothetical protein JWM82_282 [Myxococcales bacterium]|nr:hypothetical protein [Myxococcales bacterium]
MRNFLAERERNVARSATSRYDSHQGIVTGWPNKEDKNA